MKYVNWPNTLTAIICLIVAQTAISGPWPGYGRTTQVPMYSADPGYQENYRFGVTKTFLGYRDPNINEAYDNNNPLFNLDYATYNLIIVVNKETNPLWGRAQTLRVYDRRQKKHNGLVYYWLISTGIPGYETPDGFFVPQSFSSRHWSKAFDAPMLNSVFFSGGKAFHTSIDTEAMNKLGEAFSHGCIHIEDHRAQELFHLIGHSGYGRVAKINTNSGRPMQTANGDTIEISSYKTLIIVR